MRSDSPFTIETPSNGLRLGASREGSATFTVYNASGRSQRAQALLVADPPQALEWLTLAGEAHRTFPVAGTERFTVEIDVPEDAPAGSYNFRLDVQGEENTDRSRVQGPTVSFQVPEAVVPGPRVPWRLVAIAAGVLAVAVAAFLVLRPRDVLVPDVANLDVVSGSTRLLDVGLGIVQPLTQQSSGSVPRLSIIGTVPPGGESVRRGSQVEVIVSTGPRDIVCVRFPCVLEEVVGNLDAQVAEAVRIEEGDEQQPELFLDLDALRRLDLDQ